MIRIDFVYLSCVLLKRVYQMADRCYTKAAEMACQ